MRRVMMAMAVLAVVVAPPARAGGCADEVNPGAFSSQAELAAWNQVMSGLGARPTGSEAHEAFISWLEDRLGEISGLTIDTVDYPIDRWLETGSSLTIDPGGTPVDVPVAGAVPYSEATTSSGELVYLPPTTPIGDADVAGKIVVRDVVPGVIPMPVFFAVAYYVHDPALSFDYTGNYERDWASAAARITDIDQATAKGAAGIVFAHPFPREQMQGDYHPYEGEFYELPMVYVGVDEAQTLKAAAGSTVELTVEAERTDDVFTRNVIATLPGDPQSPMRDERINIASHTDGMNAVWDNGPIAILGLAKYFASLDPACRPRTIQFAFTSAHLYLSEVGAEKLAEELDAAYDERTVAFAVAIEHLGAKEFLGAPREDPGLPGQRLAPSGKSELFAVFVHESPVTLQAVMRSVVGRDLHRTFVLRGADAPAVRFPPHVSYGGEGGPYHQHLVPTVAAITGPATLFKPAFTQGELLDPELMRRQTMAFGDVVLRLGGVPRELIAGADTAYRIGRDATAEATLP